MEKECDAVDEETTNCTFHPPPPIPEEFSVAKDVVSEEAWEEIRSYLGLRLDVAADNDDNDDDEGIGETSCVFPCWDNDIHIIDLDNLDRDEKEKYNDDLMNRCRSSSEILWESTPPPQNRPVAQFGFRYDYERDIVVVPVDDEENLTVQIEKDNEKEETTSDRYFDASAKAAAAVPKIPELFKRLLLRPYCIQSSGIVIQDDIINDDDEDEIKTSVGIFTQCIVNVYRPTTTTTTTSPKEINRDYNDETATDSSNNINGSHIPWHIDDHRFGPVILVFTFGETRPLNMRLKKHNNDDKYDYDDIDDDDDDDDDIDCCKRYSYFTAHPPHRSCYKLSGLARTRWEHSIPTGTGWRVSITFRSVLSDAVEWL
jgi:hypothetical protein